MLQKVSQFDLEERENKNYDCSRLKPVVVGEEQLWLLRAGDGPLGDLLSHVAGKLALLELVAEEDLEERE